MTAAMVAGVVSPVAAAGKSFPDVQPVLGVQNTLII